MAKYHLYCTACGREIEDFGQWFAEGQKCSCGCQRAEARYFTDYGKLEDLCKQPAENLFHWFDFLPLEKRENIVTLGEGAVPFEEWQCLKELAKQKYGIDCTPLVSRSDLSGGTGTFKDPAGALGASLFKEWGVKHFCAASTGNTATAFSRYCSEAGVKFTIFVPNDVSPDTALTIMSHDQDLRVSQGGYGDAKKEAAAFSKETGTLMTAGNIDPIRVESKRTLVFEYLRQLGRIPDVYVQAVAGGTAPIALDKGVRELNAQGIGVKLPRMILAQQDTCDPMVLGWEKAKAGGFPEGWEKDFPTVTPRTAISILSTGTPGMFPIVAPIVRKSGGSFVRVREDSLVDLAKWIFKNTDVIPGPAAMVCIAGFIKALGEGLIKNGDIVSINMGEGSARNTKFRKAVEQ